MKMVILGVGLGSSVHVETTHLDESCRLLSVRSANIFEVLAESVRVIGNSVVKYHIASQGMSCLTMEDYTNG